MRALSPRNLRGTSNARSDDASRSRFNSAGARYNVLDRAGEGTLFVTYRVRDKSSDRVLALKALKSAYSKHTQFAPVVAQGAAKLLNLQHPHIAQMYEIGQEEGTTFLVTEWLAGQSLEARLRRAPFGRIEALTSTRQIAEGLRFLHENNIVHGDLRPRQVLGSGDGLLKLTDAATSGAFAAAGLSIVDVQQDSIYYLAPERTPANSTGDAPATVASDLYALGAMLYRMLSGRVPFAGPSPVAVAMRHRHDEPLPPSRYNLQCPPDLEEIALRLLAKEPAQRFASAQQVLDALTPPRQPAIAPVSSPQISQTQSASTAPPNDADTSNLQSSTRSDDAASFNNASPNSTSPNSVLSNSNADDNASAHAVSANTALFPANLPISALAATPLSQISQIGTSATIAAAATAAANTATANAAAVAPTAQAQTIAPSQSAASPGAASPGGGSQGGGLQSKAAPTMKNPQATDDEKKARKKQRRREFWGAFLALIWVFIGLAMFAGVFYGSYRLWEDSAPKNVRVPSYIGKSQARVSQDLRKIGLQVGEVNEVYDPKRAAGTVINGNPRPGREVKIGRTVSLTISRGAEQIAMPDLSDLNLNQVRQVLARAGMKIGNVTEIYNERVAKGYICGQFPSPGEAFSRSDPINLVLSRGAQPNADTQNATDLLPPPPPPSTSTSTQDDPLTTPNTKTSTGDGAPLVSRTALVRVPVPPKAGAAPDSTTERNVKIEVRDANGTNTVYEAPHLPGELIDEYVRVTRPQGSSATISIYIDGKLQKQQKV